MTREQLEVFLKGAKLNSLIQLCKKLKEEIEFEEENEDLKVDTPPYQYLKGQEDILDIILDFINK